MKSLICEIIKEHKDDWREYFRENYPSIIIKDNKLTDEVDPYVIFNYGIGSDFSDPVIKEARGIIIDINKVIPVCWAFNKFGKYDDNYADIIDWGTARVQEKLDGSIIKMWYSDYKNQWVFSTNSTIYAEDAYVHLDDNISFMNVIHMTDEYIALSKHLSGLCTDYTFIFELVSIYNQVVVKYDKPKLYHIGTRNNVTGNELNIDMKFIDQPYIFNLYNLDECINYINNISNTDFYINPKGSIFDKCNQEGFVVVDANYNRVKIKSPIYMVLHNIVSGSTKSIKLLLNLLLNKRINIQDLSNQYPSMAHILKYYDYQLEKFLYEGNKFINQTRLIYNYFDEDKSKVAQHIKNSRYSNIGFISIKDEYICTSLKDILVTMGQQNQTIEDVLLKFIPKYEIKSEIDFSKIFTVEFSKE